MERNGRERNITLGRSISSGLVVLSSWALSALRCFLLIASKLIRKDPRAWSWIVKFTHSTCALKGSELWAPILQVIDFSYINALEGFGVRGSPHPCLLGQLAVALSPNFT